MQAISVINGGTPTLVAPAGNRDFLHIYNNSDTVIYVGYDGDTVNAPLTTANGMPIPVGGTLALENVGPRNIFLKAVNAIHSAGVPKELRVQGV